MNREAFEALVAEIGFSPIPEKFQEKLKNVELLVEDVPDIETRHEHGLDEDETLLGLYQGIPLAERGSEYGVGITLPDTITVYYLPTIEASQGDMQQIRAIVEDTIRHEVGHFLGMNEAEVEAWEAKNAHR